MGAEKATLSVLEHAHMTEMQEDLRRRLEESRKAEANRIDSLRMSILSNVVAENYEGAMDMVRNYVDAKDAYPAFQARVERYVNHCADLISAIQTKRHFPGMATLSLAKQQEIYEKVISHFEELKDNLKLIEKIERENKLIDVRSTVWVLRTLSVVVFAIVATTFVMDLRSGLLSSLIYTTGYYLDKVSTWFVNLVM